jgi:hypothetical protein
MVYFLAIAFVVTVSVAELGEYLRRRALARSAAANLASALLYRAYLRHRIARL